MGDGPRELCDFIWVQINYRRSLLFSLSAATFGRDAKPARQSYVQLCSSAGMCSEQNMRSQRQEYAVSGRRLLQQVQRGLLIVRVEVLKVATGI
jgi:hypothetical protein